MGWAVSCIRLLSISSDILEECTYDHVGIVDRVLVDTFPTDDARTVAFHDAVSREACG
jgi:hypothetical protein